MLRRQLRDLKLKLQTVEDIIDSQQAEIIELKHNNNSSSNNDNNNNNNSPTKRNKNKNNNNSNDDDLLNAARRALSASPSNISRDNISSSSSLSSKTNKNIINNVDIDINIDDDINKYIKNPIALKPTPRIVKEVGVNESRLEQLLKQNNEKSKWSEYKKHDRLFEAREIHKGRIKNKHESNDLNKNDNDIQIYDDIEEKDVEKYKPPLPPKHKIDDDDLKNSRVKSIFRTASDVIKNSLSVRRSWDSRSPSPAGDNSDTRSNTSDKSNASMISKSSNSSITRGRLLGVKKKTDITIYPTDHDDDIQDLSYI